MGIIKKISRFFSSSNRGDEAAYWIYVRCDRCGEKLSTRVNLYNDLSVDYDESEDHTYICRKTMVGSSGCFQRIEIQLIFDKNRKLIDREITGGTFIEEGEYSVE
jgi:hypothetical protein